MYVDEDGKGGFARPCDRVIGPVSSGSGLLLLVVILILLLLLLMSLIIGFFFVLVYRDERVFWEIGCL